MTFAIFGMPPGECSLDTSVATANLDDILRGKGGKCTCESGFSGGLCEYEETCLDHNLTCMNGGNCTDLSTGHCSCPPGFTGYLCQYNVSIDIFGDSANELSEEWIIN